jgi:hypothetical protein
MPLSGGVKRDLEINRFWVPIVAIDVGPEQRDKCAASVYRKARLSWSGREFLLELEAYCGPSSYTRYY